MKTTATRALRSEIIMFRITEGQRNNLDRVAQQLDLTVSEVIRVAIGEYVARQVLIPWKGDERPPHVRRVEALDNP